MTLFHDFYSKGIALDVSACKVGKVFQQASMDFIYSPTLILSSCSNA